ncbi:MAG TPA: NADH-quinone oxidoreductase subunit NuoG [Steroidobacteraceae bacterium]|nr:NADH-quinone oxidoreductase subunit NuoG [Steroidobacteraceae bacterium]
MSEELVNIEVDGVPMKARKNAMIIHVTDANGVYVPRFCYHDKLSIAANCRMCLVEVEKAPKPMPACATPVAEGMKVFTRSPKAISAQKATMEFLLINHPLDCPICDQGGECELQDLAMGFGRDVSRYSERKRVFKDQNLGPLISTDMTRCIHCTRCVRFGQEIAGVPALGTIGRGEMTQISTFIEQNIEHELSANIVDLCPVGALNNKPYRYRARAWEMTQAPLVSPHDCVGTNLHGHVLRGRLMRVVPRANDAINETWIADRDRFSYEGFYAPDRASRPMVKDAGTWREVDWETALETAAKSLQQVVREAGPAQLGVLASPISTLEELALTAKVARGLGTQNVDHRLRRVDFRDQANDPVAPTLGCSIAELEQAAGVLVVGCDVRKEVPLLAHRIRQGAVRRGAKVAFINPRSLDLRFPVVAQLTSNGYGMAQHLAAVLLAALRAAGKPAPATVAASLEGITPALQHEAVASALGSGELKVVLLGALAQRHVAYAELRSLAQALAAVTGAKLGYLPEGGNGVGAALAGVLPHRTAGGRPVPNPGLTAVEMLAARLKGYVLVGGIESGDVVPGLTSEASLKGADCVVAITPYASEEILSVASVILPSAVFAETSGTWINVEGRWQSVTGAARPAGEARPAWKILRVLGNLLGLAGFDYASSEEVRDELQRELAGYAGGIAAASAFSPGRLASMDVTREVGIYQVDAVVRRSAPLQATADGQATAAPRGGNA